jgi:hypothetical protein
VIEDHVDTMNPGGTGWMAILPSKETHSVGTVTWPSCREARLLCKSLVKPKLGESAILVGKPPSRS